MLYNRFLYNADGTEGGGKPQTTDAPPAEEQKPEMPESIQIPLSELESLGFKSIDELKAHFNKPAEPTEEEKAIAAQKEKADFLKFSTEEGILNVDDYQAFESIKAKKDRDLVFENFTQEFLEDNPDATDYEIENAFNNQYHIDSENVTLKKRGEKILAKEAAEIRNPYQTKYDKAWNTFSERKELQSKVPLFNNFVDDVVNKVVPQKLKAFEKEIDGENVSVEIELTAEDKAEIAKKFKMNVKAYDMYVKGESEKLNADLSRKINGFIREKYAEKIQEQIFETAVTLGKKKGSNVGAINPFPLVNGNAIVRSIGGQSVMEELNRSHAEAAASVKR